MLRAFIRSKSGLAVITGAGISTESGIPDYRGPKGSYRLGHKPVTYQEFLSNPIQRQRYWARSMKAWPIFSEARPSLPHIYLQKLESLGKIHYLITQNVDSLHHKAGSQNVLELHGKLREGICLSCKGIRDRTDIQSELEKKNPAWISKDSYTHDDPSLRADGDVEPQLQNQQYSTFLVPQCTCQSNAIMKPNVVLFGENCAKLVVDESFKIISQVPQSLLSSH
uniref:Deacetylase sirtuin-type domain-containing protein n=1 Tax=Arcella intermedia TaxID=1963864 RepID=A0A6B2LGY5_9EUKA